MAKKKAKAKAKGDAPKFGSPEWRAAHPRKGAKKSKSSKRDGSGKRMID